MISRFLYRYIFRRTSSFVLGIVIASAFFERAYDHACESIFEWINEGRLWMHIKHNYENSLRTQTQSDRKGAVEEETLDLQKVSDENARED
ncbi:cytochrome b-c1 complex subunit 9 [Bombus affinis]|uniref:cytochrome b-c1 complex subunit 9 n=1 Tax=Bombus affinis TaxID=309941 RepID=UPI0021B7969A|nr:cytochrome b-c1 complex subunit 9 [Bombus affinis]